MQVSPRHQWVVRVAWRSVEAGQPVLPRAAGYSGRGVPV